MSGILRPQSGAISVPVGPQRAAERLHVGFQTRRTQHAVLDRLTAGAHVLVVAVTPRHRRLARAVPRRTRISHEASGPDAGPAGRPPRDRGGTPPGGRRCGGDARCPDRLLERHHGRDVVHPPRSRPSTARGGSPRGHPVARGLASGSSVGNRSKNTPRPAHRRPPARPSPRPQARSAPDPTRYAAPRSRARAPRA